jgi:hypothetical protein
MWLLCWRWLHGGYTVQNTVLVATQWLHAPQKEKACYFYVAGFQYDAW